MNKKAPEKVFTFDEKGHKYTLDGKPLTGVTTILQVVAKPMLIQWAADEACKYVKHAVKQTIDDENYENALYEFTTGLDDLLEEARLTHRKKKEQAGGVGTEAHKWIENWVNSLIAGGDPPPLPVDETVHEMVENFVEWAEENKIKFLASEHKVYSEEHWYAGTFDLLFEMEGRRYIGDVKTTSAIYGREFFAQMAAYQIAWEEMFGKKDKINGRMIIRLGKTGDFETKESLDYEIDKKFFLAALDIYRINNNY